jgi:hypothetical protein
MAEAEQHAVIRKTVAAIAAAGAPPVGWHTRSCATPDTADRWSNMAAFF